VTGSAVYLKGGIILPGLTPWHVAASAGKTGDGSELAESGAPL